MVAKEKLSKLCKKLGYQTNELALLNSSTAITDWLYPSIISVSFLTFNFIWIAMNNFIFPISFEQKTLKQYLVELSILRHINEILGFSSLQLLAWVYFGSIIASVYQLKNGTKYKPFPRFLDILLKQRKQYGLWAFLFATLHALLTLYMANHEYLNLGPNNKMIVKIFGQLTIALGSIAYILFIFAALGSISSLTNMLNWKRWHFVQTKIGISCLFIGTVHNWWNFVKIFKLKAIDSQSYTTYVLTR